MKRSWQTLLGVLVLGLLAGFAIAGRPTTPPNDIRITSAEIPGPTDDDVNAVSTTVESVVAETASGTAPPSINSDGAVSATTTTTTTTTTTDTTLTANTATASSTEDFPSTDRTLVRVVVANATDRSGIARDAAERLRSTGYTQVVATDTRLPVFETAIYARSGFEVAAEVVAADLGVGPERVQPLADRTITDIDGDGDVIVALGPDLVS